MTELWANTWPRCFGSQTRLAFAFDDLIALELFLVYLAVKIRTLQTIVECGHVTQTCAIRQRAPANSGAKLFSRFCFCGWIAEQCGNRVHTLKISLDWQNLRSIICQQIRGIVGVECVSIGLRPPLVSRPCGHWIVHCYLSRKDDKCWKCWPDASLDLSRMKCNGGEWDFSATHPKRGMRSCHCLLRMITSLTPTDYVRLVPKEEVGRLNHLTFQ